AALRPPLPLPRPYPGAAPRTSTTTFCSEVAGTSPGSRGCGTFSGDFGFSSGALPEDRMVMILLSMSNQKGAPNETANIETIQPRRWKRRVCPQRFMSPAGNQRKSAFSPGPPVFFLGTVIQPIGNPRALTSCCSSRNCFWPAAICSCPEGSPDRTAVPEGGLFAALS